MLRMARQFRAIGKKRTETEAGIRRVRACVCVCFALVPRCSSLVRVEASRGCSPRSFLVVFVLLANQHRAPRCATLCTTPHNYDAPQLEEAIGHARDRWSNSLQELETLRSSNQEKPLAAKQLDDTLAKDRARFESILSEQHQRMETAKRNHRFDCQELCESVLEASEELDRLRNLLANHAAAVGTRPSGRGGGHRSSPNRHGSTRGSPPAAAGWMAAAAVATLVAAATVAVV